MSGKRKAASSSSSSAKRIKARWTESAQQLEDKFGVPFPSDFFAVWELAQGLKPADPRLAFQEFGVRLVGPFDVLAGDFDSVDEDDVVFHLHYRYTYDPPEFLTVLQEVDPEAKTVDDGTTSAASQCKHWGYFRDDPAELPSFVAVGNNHPPSSFAPVADNLLAALHSIVSAVTKAKPAMKNHALVAALSSTAAEYDLVLQGTEALSKYRQRKKGLIAHPYHGLGMVVPFEDDVGYRPLNVLPSKLRVALKSMVSQHKKGVKVDYGVLDGLLPLVAYANDEGDPGMALELGLDLFVFDTLFNKTAKRLLSVAYALLDRDVFAEIINAHCRKRKKKAHTLSQLPTK